MMQKSFTKVSNWKYNGRKRIISFHVPLISKNILGSRLMVYHFLWSFRKTINNEYFGPKNLHRI